MTLVPVVQEKARRGGGSEGRWTRVERIYIRAYQVLVSAAVKYDMRAIFLER